MRAPHLYSSLRAFALDAFRLFSGDDLPFAFEEHVAPGRPALYEYRPLVRGFLEERVPQLAHRADARAVIADLRNEPAARIFSRAHAHPRATEDDALFRTVVVPLLIATAEGCGGFDWDDTAFDKAYEELEQSLYGEGHAYAAVAPLVGISTGKQIDLGDGLRIRHAVHGELAQLWPEARGLLPKDFGREEDRTCVLELSRELAHGDAEPPDAPGEIADAITALRLATAAPIAAGPVLFERLDWRPFGIRPVLPITATQPHGEPDRLDEFRGRVAAELRERLILADEDPHLADALDRWELSVFQDDPFRGEQVNTALESLLGNGDGLWAAKLRIAMLLGDKPRDRAELLAHVPPDAVRRALIEAVLHGNRRDLVATLDEAILGVRPRPSQHFTLKAAS